MKGRQRFSIKFSELFPTVMSQIIFVAYMAFCVGQGIFVTASRKKGENYNYNTVTVVLLTEVMKLVLATICFLKDDTCKSLFLSIRSNLKILILYLVPSFLYCIYNNLAFVNLSIFDPTTYFILLQLRVVITGIIFQIIFSKKLSKRQWLSLILLTCGCMIQQIDWKYVTNLFSESDGTTNVDYLTHCLHLLFIIIQTLCSCFAGVYNEHLLKDIGPNVNIFVQNIFMYLDSIFWNLAVLFYQGNIADTFSQESFSPILKPMVIIIIVNSALVGITTSLFLKNLNSILKTFASAIELLFTAVLCWIIFGISIKINTVFAIIIVTYSTYLYSQNPVSNRVKQTVAEHEERLLDNV